MYASVLYCLDVPILISKVHVSKILFHLKISPINMAMYPLFAVQPRERGPEQRGRGLDRGQGGGQGIPVGGLCQRPLATSPPPLSQRGRWSVVLYFLFPPTFTFISWPSFNSIFHN